MNNVTALKQHRRDFLRIYGQGFLYYAIIQFLYTTSDMIPPNTSFLNNLSISLKVLYLLLLIFPIAWCGIGIKKAGIKKVFGISKSMVFRYWSVYLIYLWMMHKIQGAIYFNAGGDLSWCSIQVYNPTPWGEIVLDGSFTSFFILEYIYQLTWGDISALFFMIIPIIIHIQWKLKNG